MIAPFILTRKEVACVAVRNFNTDAKGTFSLHASSWLWLARTYLFTSIRCVHLAIDFG